MTITHSYLAPAVSVCVFKGENVHISELQTTNVTASPLLREYNTRPQTHTRVREYTTGRNDTMEVKSPCYRWAAEDTGCGNERIEFLSPELEAGHEQATHKHTQTPHFSQTPWQHLMEYLQSGQSQNAIAANLEL